MSKKGLPVQPVYEQISSYKNELLLHGKFGSGPGKDVRESIDSGNANPEYDTLEPETEYAQIMRIYIEDML